MARALHSLQVAGPTGAVFRVTDGASKCVGIGMHRLDLELPQGMYTVSALLGTSVETSEVLLDEQRSISFQSTMPSFGERAFSLAPQVMAALGPYEFPDGGHLIALRGPWRDERTAADRVTLDRDGTSVPHARAGFLSDPLGQGVWSWQLFDLARESPPHPDEPGVLSVTRSVCDTPRGLEPQSVDQAPLEPPKRVSHILPHWGDWLVWAAYPATACGAPEDMNLPLAYYLRLRFTVPGAVPAPHLQSLSDQVFTALAARTGLPLSKPVLDLLLSSDEADPLLALGAAHLASITLGWLGRLRRLPHDAPQAQKPGATSEVQSIEAEVLYQRFHEWLKRHDSGPLSVSPDIVAARFLFGIDTRAHVRVPPVLLRSLDGLIDATSAPDTQAAGTTCDDGVWGKRLQISDSFAFLQWQSDADYSKLLIDSLERSLQSAKAVQTTVRLIEGARAQVEKEKREASQSGRAQRSPLAGRAATPSLATAPEPDSLTSLSSLDLEAFIKSNATSLRIPASAISQFSSALKSLPIDPSSVEASLQRWVGRLTKD